MSQTFIRIVSGGQTGVDRAALDAALELGIPCGGWCPKGRLTEDGPLDERYPLQETPSEVYEQRTLWNVRDADATLILAARTPLSGGTQYTLEAAEGLRKPYRVVVLDGSASFTFAADWIGNRALKVLNVAGPRESGAPGIYRKAHAFMVNLLRYLREQPM